MKKIILSLFLVFSLFLLPLGSGVSFYPDSINAELSNITRSTNLTHITTNVNNLTFYFPFDSNSTGRVQRDLVSGWNGTGFGSTSNLFSKDIGYIGNSLSFDGLNQYFEIPNSTNIVNILNPQREWTVMIWVNKTTSAANTIFSIANATQAQRQLQLFCNGGIFTVIVGGVQNATTIPCVQDGSAWQHVALVNRNDSGTMRFSLIINGTSYGNTGLSGTATLNYLDFLLGARRSLTTADATSLFIGNLDELMIFNRNLSLAEIQGYAYKSLPVFVNNGTLKTQDFTFAGSRLNITADEVTQFNGTKLFAQICLDWYDPGPEIVNSTCGPKTQFSGNSIINYDLPTRNGTQLYNGNITFYYEANGQRSYTPSLGGNITFSQSSTIKIAYPQPYVVYQRDCGRDACSASSTASVRVRVENPALDTLEGRLNGGTWSTLSCTYSGTICTASFTRNVTQGLLEVRRASDTSNTDNKTQIGVGEVFLMLASGAMVGSQPTPQFYNRTASANGYNASVYSNDWNFYFADDPIFRFGTPISTRTANGTWVARYFSMLARELNVPIMAVMWGQDTGETQAFAGPAGFMSTGFYYNTSLNALDIATDGTRKVRTVIWQSGGADISNRIAESVTYNNIISMANNYQSAVSLQAGTVCITQKEARTNSNFQNRTAMDNLRRAQLRSWDATNIVPCGTTYDPVLGDDGFRWALNSSIQKIAERHFGAIIQEYFNSSFDGQGPIISMIEYNETGRNDTIKFTWTDRTGLAPNSNIIGFSANDSTIGQRNNSDIVSAYTVGNTTIVRFNANISTSTSLSYGSLNDAYNGTNLNDSTQYGFPAQTFYSLNVGYGVIGPETPVTTCQASGNMASTIVNNIALLGLLVAILLIGAVIILVVRLSSGTPDLENIARDMIVLFVIGVLVISVVYAISLIGC